MWWTGASAALACGGFFCDGYGSGSTGIVVGEVDQAAEDIVFVVEGGEVTTHVRIGYQGEAATFAWVVPVSGVPDLFLSTIALFEAAKEASDPQYTLRTDDLGCSTAESDSDADTDTESDADTDRDTDGVVVESREVVGPYETVVLSAEDPGALVEWLQTNGYGIPDEAEAAMGPYVASDMSFLALRLLKDADVGQLSPLGFRYAGERPAIPLQLTSIAALVDMPVRVYVFGPSRAVPLTWLHVDLNPLAMPFFPGMPTIDDQLPAAAREVGGRMFTTHLSIRHAIDLVPPRLTTAALRTAPTALAWFQGLAPIGLTSWEELAPVLRTQVPAPEEVSEAEFYGTPGKYPAQWAALDATFDAAVATEDLETRVVDPRRAAQAEIDDTLVLTRLDTRVSPWDMTIDPVFGFNPDLPPVDGRRTATWTRSCDGGDPEDSPSTLELPTGHVLRLPPAADVAELLQGSLGHVGLVVTQMSESGPGEVVADWTSELDALEEATNASVPIDGEVETTGAPTAGATGSAATVGGCGCGTGPGGPAAALGLLVAGAAVARRRSRGRPGP